MVLWASHASSRARAVSAEVGAALAEDPIPIVLERCDPLIVRVLGSGGEGVPGAVVVERAVSAHDARVAGRTREPSREADIAPEWLEQFERHFVTDSAGTVSAHPAAFTLELVARRGQVLSRPRLADPGQGEVVLELREPASALGTVHLPYGFDPADEIRVSVFQRSPSLVCAEDERLLGIARVETSGSWGPLEVAPDPEHLLIFRLDGGSLVPEEKQLDPRQLRSPFVVDFTPRIGLDLPVLVFVRRGPERAPVPGARVEFIHRLQESEPVARVSGWTDQEGRVLLRGCPETTGAVIVRASGFTSGDVRPVALPRTVDVEVELAEGGVLFGRCLHDGQPVRDFDVFLWQGEPRERVRHSYRDRVDGSFRIDGAPSGMVQTCASSPGQPECDVQTLEIHLDQPRETVFELPSPVVGRGRVVDAHSLEPIANAQLRILVTASMVRLDERGPVHGVLADGSFEIAAFPPRDTLLLVEAAGYGSRRVEGSYSAEGGVTFGEIALARAQALEARIVAPASYDASQIWFLGQGPTIIPFTRFPVDGRLVIPDVSPGYYRFVAAWQDGSNVTRVAELVAGRPWVLEFSFDPEHELLVEVVGTGNDPLPEGCDVLIIHPTAEGGEAARSASLDERGIARFYDFEATEVLVVVKDSSGRDLGLTRKSFGASEERRVRLVLSKRSLEILVLDSEMRPVPSAHLHLSDPSAGSYWALYSATGADGRHEILGVALDTLLLDVQHPSAGSASNLVVNVAEVGRTEIEVTLQGGEDLRARVMDEERPAGGVTLELYPSVRSIHISSRHTDADGAASWARMQPGRYQVHVNSTGYWPTWHELELRGGGQVHSIEALRLGELVLRLRDVEGHALPGLAVEGIALELGESVSSWAQSRRIHARPAELRTDVAGELRLQGIPRGTYRLRIQTPAGEWVERELRVPGGRVLEELVVLE